MTLTEARARVGAGVVYTPYPGVLYRGDTCAKATSPDQLTPLTPLAT